AARGRQDREVGRGAVGIDVCEPAGHGPFTSERVPRALPHAADQILEPIPGYRGLEGLGEDAAGDQRVPEVGRLEEGIAPRGRGLAAAGAAGGAAVAGGTAGRGAVTWAAAVVLAQLQRAAHPQAELVVRGLEGQDQERGPAVR